MISEDAVEKAGETVQRLLWSCKSFPISAALAREIALAALTAHEANSVSPDALTSGIAEAIDHWHAAHPDLSVGETLAALEEVRHKLTEATLR